MRARAARDVPRHEPASSPSYRVPATRLAGQRKWVGPLFASDIGPPDQRGVVSKPVRFPWRGMPLRVFVHARATFSKSLSIWGMNKLLLIAGLLVGCSNPIAEQVSGPRPLALGETDQHATGCGNGFCEAGETHASCANDCCELDASGACAPVCGNGFCDGNETHASCASDCCETGPTGHCLPTCGNGFCEIGESNASCAGDCCP